MINTKKYKKKKNKTKHKNKPIMIHKRRTKNINNYKKRTYKIGGGMYNGLISGNGLNVGNTSNDATAVSRALGWHYNQQTHSHAGVSNGSSPSMFSKMFSLQTSKHDIKPGAADKKENNAINNPAETALVGVSIVNKKNPNPVYKFLINTLLDRFVGNTKYLVNAFNMQPNKIDVVCIINFDKDNKNKIAIKILPYYIKLCRIIKTYYNKIIIKSDLLIDESLSITDIDTREHFMNKRKKLYSGHTNTDHTQDLIDLLNDIEVRNKIDNLHSRLPKNIGNMSGGAMQIAGAKDIAGAKAIPSSLAQNINIPTATAIQNANAIPIVNAVPFTQQATQQFNNNDSIHNIIEELFNDKIGVTKTICPVEIKHCPDDEQQPLPDITGKQYLILDLVYTIYTDKHEIYTKRTKENPDQCILVAEYNNLDNSKPGLYVTARTT